MLLRQQMPQAVCVPCATRGVGCLNKDGTVTDGHTSPCNRDRLPGVFAVVLLSVRRGEQEDFFLYGGQYQHVQGHHLGHLYGVTDAAIAHLQTGEGAAIAVVAAVLAVKGSVVVYFVARVVEHMLYAGVATVVTAVSDGIHARACPYKAYCQHDCDTICQPLFHFGGKGTAF